MKQFKISEELATKILNYLGTRPYIEVLDMVQTMQQMELIKEESVGEKREVEKPKSQKV